jgi:two-component system, chemotaxis family, chemotaxis protein CheY
VAAGEAPILVVEDHDDTREVVRSILALSSYESVGVDSALEALRYLRTGGRARLILLDLHLPGMDGRAFLRELRADPAFRGIPVVVFSGDSGTGVEGTEGFVRKGSDDPDVLLGVISAALRR